MKSFISDRHLSGTWQFVQGWDPESIRNIPETVISFSMPAENNRIDLDSLLPEPGKLEEDGTVFNRFSLEKDIVLAFGACCDWWFEAWLNGEKLYSTFPAGNASPCFNTEDHAFRVQAKKGENLLCIHVRRGTGSWLFGFEEKDPEAADPCSPLVIQVNPADTLGPVKPMNAVNNGPIRGRSSQTRGNFKLWQEAKIPFARNHDAAFCSAYGGEHSVDIYAVFPDFSADPEDPASYDFDLTDDYLETTLDAGTQIFYRLGSKIEHNRKKYGTKVPPDFRKWAVVCEHIIRHFNEGWANGHHWNIRYWEIWNEPDLDRDDSANKRNWQGTEKQFHELFRIAACHLKKCFPDLKIGGPALSGKFPWMRRFLKAMHEQNVPVDFFSWHYYGTRPTAAAAGMRLVRECLDQNGYTQTESILNEWNYVRDWTDGFSDTVRTIIGLKGAVYASSVMCEGQNNPLDMLMYYDARPCAFNGIFDFYTFAPLKTYYVLLAWSKLADLGTQFRIDTQNKNGIHAAGATDGKGRCGIILNRYFEPDDLPGNLEITLELKGMTPCKVYLLDETHDLEAVDFQMKDNALHLAMHANTMIYVEYTKQ